MNGIEKTLALLSEGVALAVTPTRTEYTTPGVHTFTAPAGVSYVLVSAIGCGGAGGGTNGYNAGAGGSSGISVIAYTLQVSGTLECHVGDPAGDTETRVGPLKLRAGGSANSLSYAPVYEETAADFYSGREGGYSAAGQADGLPGQPWPNMLGGAGAIGGGSGGGASPFAAGGAGVVGDVGAVGTKGSGSGGSWGIGKPPSARSVGYILLEYLVPDALQSND